MKVYFYYRKLDGSIGKLLDEDDGAEARIDMNIEAIKQEYNTNTVLACIEGGKNE